MKTLTSLQKRGRHRIPGWVLLLPILFILFFPQNARSQVHPDDVLALETILINNCGNCSLATVWNINAPINTWPGIGLVWDSPYWRVDTLNVAMKGLTGNLDVSLLSELKRCNVGGNSISGIQLSASNNNLEILQASGCQLTAITGLDSSSSLVELYCGKNLLNSLSGISSHANLEVLVCHLNNLQSLDGLQNVDALRRLECNLNNLTELPTFPTAALQYLDCSFNNIQSLANLDLAHSFLEYFIANANQLSVLPPMPPSASVVKCEDNQIKSLSGIDSLNFLSLLTCFDNVLPIAEILPVVTNTTATVTYTPQNPIEIAPDSILILEGNSFTLDAVGFGLTGTYQWSLNGTAVPTATNSSIILPNNFIEVIASCSMQHPGLPALTSQSKDIRIIPSEPIICDCNRDGIRNMLDLVQLALRYGKQGVPRSYVHMPEDTTYVPNYDWKDSLSLPLTIVHAGDTINLKHVDTNGDGIINFADFACILEYYTPLRVNRRLYNYASNNNVGFRAVPQDHLISMDTAGSFKIPFRIEIDELPPGMDSLNLRGIVFVRGIVEDDSLFVVDSIFGNMLDSDFANDTASVIGVPVYLPELILDTVGIDGLCLNLPVKQLDVGLMRILGPRMMSYGMAAIVCEVLGDARLSSNGGVAGSEVIPVVGDINTVILYVQDNQGNVFPVTAKCATDTTYLFADSLIGRVPITGTIRTWNGIPLEASVSATSQNNTVAYPTDSLGDYVVVADYGQPLVLAGSKATKCPEQEAITGEDLRLLQRGITKPNILTTWQTVAADIDENGILELNDYLLLRDFYNKVNDSLPGGNWLFISSDDQPDINNPFAFITERSYAQIHREAGQDFVGVLKGDLDFSWSPNCTSMKVANAEEAGNLLIDLGNNPQLSVSPVPSSGTVQLRYAIPSDKAATIEIRNIEGRIIRVKELQAGNGPGIWEWDRKDSENQVVVNGMYFAQMVCGQACVVQKIVLVP